MVHSFKVIQHLLVPVVLLSAGCSRRQAFSTGKPLKPVFDVPHLVHKNIDQINTLLRTSTQQEVPLPSVVVANGHTTRERAFKQDTLTLFVTYSEDSRKVFHCFLTTDHQRVADVAPLLQLGNLAGNNPRLLIDTKVSEEGRFAFKGVWVSVK